MLKISSICILCMIFYGLSGSQRVCLGWGERYEGVSCYENVCHKARFAEFGKVFVVIFYIIF